MAADYCNATASKGPQCTAPSQIPATCIRFPLVLCPRGWVVRLSGAAAAGYTCPSGWELRGCWTKHVYKPRSSRHHSQKQKPTDSCHMTYNEASIMQLECYRPLPCDGRQSSLSCIFRPKAQTSDGVTFEVSICSRGPSSTT